MGGVELGSAPALVLRATAHHGLGLDGDLREVVRRLTNAEDRNILRVIAGLREDVERAVDEVRAFADFVGGNGLPERGPLRMGDLLDEGGANAINILQHGLAPWLVGLSDWLDISPVR